MDARRALAFKRMRAGSIKGIIGTGTQLYGVEIDTMNKDELLIALGWSLSQNARLMPRDNIGVLKETKQ